MIKGFFIALAEDTITQNLERQQKRKQKSFLFFYHIVLPSGR